MKELIRAGVGAAGGTWAELGAGTGNFTWALAELLGAGGTVYAIDRDGKAIDRQRALLAASAAPARIIPRQADIARRLDLPALDGVLMANVLHFLHDQPAALLLAAGYLRPGGHVVLVEYDLDAPLRYVPFPVPFARFAALAVQAGLEDAAQIGRRISPSSGVAMYAALALRA